MQVRNVAGMMLGAMLQTAEREQIPIHDELINWTLYGYNAEDGLNMLLSRHLEQITDFGEVDMWDANLLYQQSLRLFDIPVVILADYGSGSAGESFVLGAQGVNNFTIIGTNTMGMAGDMLSFPLPGGGLLGLNIVKQIAPDGQIINNHGIMPDIWISQTLDDLINGIDTQLVFALEYLSERISPIN